MGGFLIPREVLAGFRATSRKNTNDNATYLLRGLENGRNKSVR